MYPLCILAEIGIQCILPVPDLLLHRGCPSYSEDRAEVGTDVNFVIHDLDFSLPCGGLICMQIPLHRVQTGILDRSNSTEKLGFIYRYMVASILSYS